MESFESVSTHFAIVQVIMEISMNEAEGLPSLEERRLSQHPLAEYHARPDSLLHAWLLCCRHQTEVQNYDNRKNRLTLDLFIQL